MAENGTLDWPSTLTAKIWVSELALRPRPPQYPPMGSRRIPEGPNIRGPGGPGIQKGRRLVCLLRGSFVMMDLLFACKSLLGRVSELFAFSTNICQTPTKHQEFVSNQIGQTNKRGYGGSGDMTPCRHFPCPIPNLVKVHQTGESSAVSNYTQM